LVSGLLLVSVLCNFRARVPYNPEFGLGLAQTSTWNGTTQGTLLSRPSGYAIQISTLELAFPSSASTHVLPSSPRDMTNQAQATPSRPPHRPQPTLPQLRRLLHPLYHNRFPQLALRSQRLSPPCIQSTPSRLLYFFRPGLKPIFHSRQRRLPRPTTHTPTYSRYAWHCEQYDSRRRPIPPQPGIRKPPP
jgi:hypothetical protein